MTRERVVMVQRCKCPPPRRALPPPQITDFNFDSSAVEVVGLAVLRWVVLATVLLRSRACLVRVKADGTIKPSVDAIVALTTCAVSAGYCVFKVGTCFAASTVPDVSGGCPCGRPLRCALCTVLVWSWVPLSFCRMPGGCVKRWGRECVGASTMAVPPPEVVYFMETPGGESLPCCLCLVRTYSIL